jgi:hypothetical protein
MKEAKFPNDIEGAMARIAAGKVQRGGFSPVLQPSVGLNACIHRDKFDSCNQGRLDDRVPTH